MQSYFRVNLCQKINVYSTTTASKGCIIYQIWFRLSSWWKMCFQNRCMKSVQFRTTFRHSKIMYSDAVFNLNLQYLDEKTWWCKLKTWYNQIVHLNLWVLILNLNLLLTRTCSVAPTIILGLWHGANTLKLCHTT